MELNLSSIQPCLSGPKRPHDKVLLKDMKKDFNDCLPNKNGFKGFEVATKDMNNEVTIKRPNYDYTLKHGSLVIAAITSCTNTSNPDVMIQAGLVCKKANALGLHVKDHIKTSLSPGSGVVQKYLEDSNLLKEFESQNFYIAGFGCMTCIGNSGELDDDVVKAIEEKNLVASAVLSGNRNFEARVHRYVKAAYLASPPLVVAYALAGRCDIDFETEPIGKDKNGNDVFLRDIWPSKEEVTKYVNDHVKSNMFKDVYNKLSKGTDRWNALQTPNTSRYQWKESSTYIHNPPFFKTLTKDIKDISNINNA